MTTYTFIYTWAFGQIGVTATRYINGYPCGSHFGLGKAEALRQF